MVLQTMWSLLHVCVVLVAADGSIGRVCSGYTSALFKVPGEVQSCGKGLLLLPAGIFL